MAGSGLAALLLLVATAVAPAQATSPVPVSAPAAVRAPAQEGGLRVESTTTYTLDLPATTIRVRYEVTLTNQSPNVISGGYINQRYFSEYGIGVLAEATNAVATKDDGTSLSVRTEPTESSLFSVLIADLVPNLFHPQSQTFTLTFDLPRLGPRADGITRVNEAFATFPVYGVGDPGLTTIEVVLPDHLEVELIGDDMEKSTRDGVQVYRAEAIAEPDDFFVDVVARDDDKLVRREVDLGEHDIVVLGWPDDPEWADFVAGLVGDGVPAMSELIGIDWPAEKAIDVVETVAPYLYGYAGWYQPSESLIEVGDELDAHVILHELSHLWFNDELFRGRWINEALADVFSAHVLAELGEEPIAPEPVDPGHPGALRLNQWGEPDLQAGDTEAQEAYGYNTSWSFLHGVVEEVGIEALAAAVVRASDGHLAYGAETVDTRRLPRADWRTLLDLLEEVSGSTTAEQAFRDLVVTPNQALVLDERAAARVDYAALVEAADGWAPPARVRTRMSDWQFADALDLIAEVTEVLEVRGELAAVLDDIEAELPRALQGQYEAAADVGDLADLVDTALAAGEDLREAHRSQDAGAGPLGIVGLLFTDVDGDLDRALDSLDAGDYEAAASQARVVSDRIDDAAWAGLVRLVAIALLLTVGWFVLRAVRRRRASRRMEPVDEPPGLVAPAS